MDSNRGNNGSWKENSCFTFTVDVQHKRKRAKFEQGRKSEVATIRRKGACLRCRLLKASCSEVRPCDNCVRAKLSSHVQVHKWMHCVSVSLRESNVFRQVLPSQALRNGSEMLDLGHVFAIPVYLNGESHVVWSLDWLAAHIASWVQDRTSVGFSRTGVLASPRLQVLLEPFLGTQISNSLRALMLSTLMVYNLGHDSSVGYVSKHREAFHLARATSADQVLRYLEETLTASFLNRANNDSQRLQALVILAFGVMRSLAYFDDSEIRSNVDAQRTGRRTFNVYHDASEMRDQLIGTLAHFMILLMNRIGSTSLQDQMPIILDNVRKHLVRPFLTPLPPPTEAVVEELIEHNKPSLPISTDPSTVPHDSFPCHWQPSVSESTPTSIMYTPSVLETGDDLSQWLSNDIDSLTGPSSSAASGQPDPPPFRECIVCTSPLCEDDPDPLCISCQQPPSEMWPGTKPFPSAESSLVTCFSSAGDARSGLNSLSTSITSQGSTFDDIMRHRAAGGNSNVLGGPPVSIAGGVARTPLPPPVAEEPDPTDETAWIFDAEDMDFGPPAPPLAGSTTLSRSERDDEFPQGWSLYWDDSCDEQSVYDELEAL